jgi:hypothetical protein
MMMSLTRTLLLAGIASVGLAAAAFSQTMHEETLQLGPNAVEQIYYSGDAAPQLTVLQSAPERAQPADAVLAAMMQQQAEMAAQAQQMLQQAQALLNAPMLAAPMLAAPMPAMPMVTAADSGAACLTSMSFTQIDGQQPKMTEYRSPGCGGGTAAPVRPTDLKPAYAPAVPAPKLIQAGLATPQDETPSG